MIADNSNNLRIYRDGSTMCARVIGPINRLTIPAFQQRLETALRERCVKLTLDLGAAEYLDSDGIRWLQQLENSVSGSGGEFRLAVRLDSRIDRTLRLLQLEKVFHVDHHHVEPGNPETAVACELTLA